MFNKISNGRKRATFSHRHELGWGESTKGRGASPFLSQAAEAAMTHGKRRDIRTAISTGSHSSCRLSSSPYKFHHFPHPPPVCSPLFFHPSRIGRPHHPLPSLLFEPCPTVYKVALLNWKPQLCRCYRLSSSSLLVSFLAIEPCLLSTPPETSSSPSFGSNPVQDARGWIGCHSWHWLKVAGFIGLAPFFQLLFSTWEEAGLDQKKTWLDESVWIRSLGGKFVCLSLTCFDNFFWLSEEGGDNHRLGLFPVFRLRFSNFSKFLSRSLGPFSRVFLSPTFSFFFFLSSHLLF